MNKRYNGFLRLLLIITLLFIVCNLAIYVFYVFVSLVSRLLMWGILIFLVWAIIFTFR